MATTITPATLTSTIQEDITLNGYAKGMTVTHSIITVGKSYNRIMEVGRESTPILLLGTTDSAGQIIGDEMKYFRITNVDDTNPLQIQFQYASANNWVHRIGPGETFILMSNQSAANAHNTTAGTLEDITSIHGSSMGELGVEVELIAITV